MRHRHGRLGAESAVFDEDGHGQISLEPGEPRMCARRGLLAVFGRSGLAVDGVAGNVLERSRSAFGDDLGHHRRDLLCRVRVERRGFAAVAGALTCTLAVVALRLVERLAEDELRGDRLPRFHRGGHGRHGQRARLHFALTDHLRGVGDLVIVGRHRGHLRADGRGVTEHAELGGGLGHLVAGDLLGGGDEGGVAGVCEVVGEADGAEHFVFGVLEALAADVHGLRTVDVVSRFHPRVEECQARGDLEHGTGRVLTAQRSVPGRSCRVVVGHGEHVAVAGADRDDGGRFLRGGRRVVRGVLDIDVESGLEILTVLRLEGVEARQLRLSALVVRRISCGEDFNAAGSAEAGIEGLLQPGAADDVTGDDLALGLLDVFGAGGSGRTERGLREPARPGQSLGVLGKEHPRQIVDGALDRSVVVFAQGHDGDELIACGVVDGLLEVSGVEVEGVDAVVEPADESADGVGLQAIRMDADVDDLPLCHEHFAIGAEDLPASARIRAQCEAAALAELRVDGLLREIRPPEESVLLQGQLGTVLPGLSVVVRPAPVECGHGPPLGLGDVVDGDRPQVDSLAQCLRDPVEQALSEVLLVPDVRVQLLFGEVVGGGLGS